MVIRTFAKARTSCAGSPSSPTTSARHELSRLVTPEAGGRRGGEHLEDLHRSGTGPSQQGDCTIYQTGSVVPAVPIETWVSAQLNGGVNGLQAQAYRRVKLSSTSRAGSSLPPKPGP